MIVGLIKKFMNREKLKGVYQVRHCDYSQYDSEKCRNGGCYGFWTDFTRLDNGKWEVSYGTTADFTYCPVCGSFNDHYVGEDSCFESGYSCGDFETITESELLQRMKGFKETESEHIDYE